MAEKIATGIPGLDEVLKGGLRKGSSVLVDGGPGTGKTIFALQFIVEGAKRNEPGVFITFEESVDSLRECAKSVGLELEKYEKNGLITLIQHPITTKKIMTIAAPLDIIEKKNVKRVVLDSLSLFEYIYMAGTAGYRKEVLDFLTRMKETGATLISTSQQGVTHLDEITFQPEDFLFEGLIILTRIRKSASFERVLSVIKMKGQDHSLDIYPYTIDKGGVKVFPDQPPFSLIEEDIKKTKTQK